MKQVRQFPDDIKEMHHSDGGYATGLHHLRYLLGRFCMQASLLNAAVRQGDSS